YRKMSNVFDISMRIYQNLLEAPWEGRETCTPKLTCGLILLGIDQFGNRDALEVQLPHPFIQDAQMSPMDHTEGGIPVGPLPIELYFVYLWPGDSQIETGLDCDSVSIGLEIGVRKE